MRFRLALWQTTKATAVLVVFAIFFGVYTFNYANAAQLSVAAYVGKTIIFVGVTSAVIFVVGLTTSKRSL